MLVHGGGDRPQVPPDRDHWQIKSISAHVDVRVTDEERFVEWADSWLSGSRERLFAEIVSRVDVSSRDWVLASLGRVPADGLGDSQIDYSESNFRKFISSLRSRYSRATWLVDDLSLEAATGECLSARVEIQRSDDTPDWAQCEILASYRTSDDGAIPIDAQWRLVEFLAEFCERSSASFGNIASDNSAGLTALETLLGRQPRDALIQSEQVLRGYSWVTLCPGALVARLGGVSELKASGAFIEVRPLSGGGALLRATETFDNYDDEAMRRVFRTLAPVLPAGLPREPSAPSTRRRMRLVYEDAADYRAEG
jgi:hypothetical protein